MSNYQPIESGHISTVNEALINQTIKTQEERERTLMQLVYTHDSGFGHLSWNPLPRNNDFGIKTLFVCVSL